IVYKPGGGLYLYINYNKINILMYITFYLILFNHKIIDRLKNIKILIKNKIIEIIYNIRYNCIRVIGNDIYIILYKLFDNTYIIYLDNVLIFLLN
ncbi:hypothetical protein BO83DRAFT_298964, partial [Aspergillus eucalypticola CBS 122712]